MSGRGVPEAFRRPKAGAKSDEEEGEEREEEQAAPQTFFLFGTYTPESLRQASPERTELGAHLIKKHGGHVGAVYALLGEYDLVMIVQFPGLEEALKSSVEITKATGILWTTAPAVPVEYFDKMIEEI